MALQPQVFDLLVFLIENRERIASKDDLIASVWSGRIVSDSTIDSRINAARRAIGDNGDRQELIRTIQRKGIRFIGRVLDAGECKLDGQDKLPNFHISNHTDGPSIAVLPFVNLSDDPRQEHFSDGITEDIVSALSRLRWFPVIAHSSSSIYKHRSVRLSRIAEELNAAYLVEGSVRKAGRRVRVTAQLVDVATRSHIWSERYDRDLVNTFSVQDEISQAVVSAIEPLLYATESQHVRGKIPGRMDVWELVVRALSYFWRATEAGNAQAQDCLERAIRLDPENGQALGVLANSHMFGAHMGWEDIQKVALAAEHYAVRAIDSDREDAWAHSALGHVYLMTRRFDASLAKYRQALDLNPNFAFAHGCCGLSLTFNGRWQEGYAAAKRAICLSPHDPFLAYYYGIASYAQFVGRNYRDSIALAREGLCRRGDLIGAYRVLTAAAAMAGDDRLARYALDELRRRQPNVSLAWITRNLPIRQAAERNHYLVAFRTAGLH